MNFSTARSERITAIISTIAAVIILAGGVMAYQSHHTPVDDLVQLESDFRFQLEVGFRHDTRERTQRLSELAKVSNAWQKSPQSDADRQKLADWLLEATIRSMPGSLKALPEVPNFGETSRKPAQLPPPLGEKADDILVEQPTEVEAFEPAKQAPTPVLDPQASTPQPTLPAPTSLAIKPNAPSKPEPLASQPAVTTPAVETVPEPANVAVVPTQVNLSELAARIAGYNAGLNELEFALSQIEVDDFSALAKQVEQLGDLTDDFQFVTLYYQSLSPSERRWIQPPRAPTNTLVSLQRRIDQAQDALAGDFLGEFDANQPTRIGKLRQQLAELSSYVNR